MYVWGTSRDWKYITAERRLNRAILGLDYYSQANRGLFQLQSITSSLKATPYLNPFIPHPFSLYPSLWLWYLAWSSFCQLEKPHTLPSTHAISWSKSKTILWFFKKTTKTRNGKKKLILKVEKQGTGMEALQRTDVGSMAPAWTQIP